VTETDTRYPFIAYGTDWLAFGHLVIALFLVGPLMQPVRNIWCLRVGMAACVLVIPLALICGPIRGIPFGWQCIDSAFGLSVSCRYGWPSVRHCAWRPFKIIGQISHNFGDTLSLIYVS
jgi:hypothetical protein